MNEHSVLDYPALFLAIALAVLVSAVMIWAHGNTNKRRGWIAAAGLFVVLIALGVLDLQRQQTRDTHLATVILGASLSVLGAMGTIRGTKRVTRRWIRWPMIFLATFVLLFIGLLVGATVVPRYLPF
jgi:hypothetical protein